MTNQKLIAQIIENSGINLENTLQHHGIQTAVVTFSDLEKLISIVAEHCSAIAMSQHASTSFDSYDDLDEHDRGMDDAASQISGTIRTTFGVK